MIKFPELIQKPQCGQKFKQFSFEIGESSVSRDEIFSAIAIDEETLLVESDNYGLVGESATIFITVKQAVLDETNIGFSININFKAEPPSFNLVEFIIPPLTCSNRD